MVVIGYILTILMGVILGLVGAGGSILTIPILVYLLNVNPVTATGYSLLIVGAAAFAGALYRWYNHLVNLKYAIIFSIFSMPTVLLTRSYIIPSIPSHIGILSKDILIMLLFAALMIISSIFMLKSDNIIKKNKIPLQPFCVLKMVSGSLIVGLLMGMLGAGGGFIIVPTLISVFNLSIKESVGTSLAIIAINSLFGFRADLSAGIYMDWPLLGIVISLTLIGIYIGTILEKHIKGENLKKIFAISTLTIGIMVILEEVHLLFSN